MCGLSCLLARFTDIVLALVLVCGHIVSGIVLLWITIIVLCACIVDCIAVYALLSSRGRLCDVLFIDYRIVLYGFGLVILY